MSEVFDREGAKTPAASAAALALAAHFEAPALPAYASQEADYWCVWCVFCLTHHSHSPWPGHRISHCFVSDSPYRETGYVLQYAGELTPAIRARWQAQRREILAARRAVRPGSRGGLRERVRSW